MLSDPVDDIRKTEEESSNAVYLINTKPNIIDMCIFPLYPKHRVLDEILNQQIYQNMRTL
jgi:hypothetical protein